MRQDIHNKDILLYTSTFLDRQSIFTLASCNKRIESVLRQVINKKYSYCVTITNFHNVSTQYTSYRIYPISIQLVPRMLDILNKQIRLNTLDALYVHNVFCIDTAKKFFHLFDNINNDCDIDTITNILNKYNIEVEDMRIDSTDTKSIQSIFDKLDNPVNVHLTGNYLECDKNYTSVEYLSTDVASLYLLKNFRNIVGLLICGDGEPVTCSSSLTFKLSNYTFDNLRELYVDCGCSVLLEDILNVCPKLESLHIANMDKTQNDIINIEETVGMMCPNDILSLDAIIKLMLNGNKITSYGGFLDFCLLTLYNIMYDVINNVTKKYRNIKTVNIFRYRCNKASTILEHIPQLKENYPNICKLNGNKLCDILMYAYKTVCLYCVSFVVDDASRSKMIDILVNM